LAFKRHQARKSDVIALFNFFKMNNILYKDFTLDGEIIGRMPEEDTSHIILQPDAQIGSRNAGYDPLAAAALAEPSRLIERASLFTSAKPFYNVELLKEATSPNTTPILLSQQSTDLLPHLNAGSRMLAKIFTWLYPYGLGDFGDERRVAIGWEAYVEYLLCLSDRRFAHEKTFLPLAFDTTARRRALSRASARVYQVSRDNELIGSVTASDIEALIGYEQRREDASRLHVPFELDQRKQKQGAAALIQGVAATTSAFLGSNEERKMFHRELQSLILSEGVPHAWCMAFSLCLQRPALSFISS
jgi:hypothetical protein